MSGRYTIKWNDKAAAFIARCEKPDGSGWHTKQIPKAFDRSKEVNAIHWFIDWYNSYIKTYGINVPSHNVSPATKTLNTLSARWIEYRYNDSGTKPNTLHGLSSSMNNWIKDNPSFPHESIQNLNLEKDFAPAILIKWLLSIRCSGSSLLQHAGTLRSFFADATALGWIEIATNPMDNPAIKKVISNTQSRISDDKIITVLNEETVNVLLTGVCSKINDYRRIRYLVAVSTGMRDHEIQALTFNDIYLDGSSENIPYIDVNKQLDKRGTKAFSKYEQLVSRYSKNEIASFEGAIMANPKKNSKRLIPLHPLTVAALRYWKETGWKLYVSGNAPDGDDPVFPVGGTHFNRSSSVPGNFAMSDSADLIRQDLERLQLPTTYKDKDIVFHSLRHTFSTLLANADVSEARISVMLGHLASSTAAKHYVAKELRQFYASVLLLPLPKELRLKHTVVSI